MLKSLLTYLFSSVSPYSDSSARRFAILSAVAYAPNDQVGNWTFPNKNCSLPNFSVTSTYADPSYSAYGYVGIDSESKAIVASFQGTSDRTDWITDLSTWVRYGYECIIGNPSLSSTESMQYSPSITGGNVSLGFVHYGFCTYYKSLAVLGMPEEVVSLAKKYKNYKIVLTGHSLGGAAATIGAADLALRFNIPRERLHLYTYGAPRPGDVGFAVLVNSTVGTAYRIVHNRDVVPHLAPCCHGWTGGCIIAPNCPYHAAVQIWYDNNMTLGQNYTVCGAIAEESECSDYLNLSIADHEYYFDMRLGPYCGMNTTKNMIGAESLQDEQTQAELESNGVIDTATQSLDAEKNGWFEPRFIEDGGNAAKIF